MDLMFRNIYRKIHLQQMFDNILYLNRDLQLITLFQTQ